MVNTANKIKPPAIITKIAGLIDDHKGENTVVFYIGEQSSITDYFIITTARSSIHLKSLANRVVEFLKSNNQDILYYVKTKDNSGWILLDCGNFIIHIMDQEKRSFYELEKLCFPGPQINYSSKSS